jgi:hypothetical protein
VKTINLATLKPEATAATPMERDPEDIVITEGCNLGKL